MMPLRRVPGRVRKYDPDMLEFVVGVVVGVSVTALLFIVVGPSRRVRAERPLPDDEETEILLGRTPGTQPVDPLPEIPHPREYATAELQALKRLGGTTGRRRSRS